MKLATRLLKDKVDMKFRLLITTSNECSINLAASHVPFTFIHVSTFFVVFKAFSEETVRSEGSDIHISVRERQF